MNDRGSSVRHMEQTQQFCLHFLLEMHTLTPSEPQCHLQSEKVCSSQSKSILCLTASPAAWDSKILLNIYQWLLSNYHLVVLLRLQHLFRSKEVFLSAVVLHSITGTKAGCTSGTSQVPCPRTVPSAPSAMLPAALGHSWPHQMGSGNTKLANAFLF